MHHSQGLKGSITVVSPEIFPDVDLSSVFTPDSIMPLLSDPEFREQLAPFLPAGEELPQSPTELSNTLRSPQFQQVLYGNGMVCSQPLTPEHQCSYYPHCFLYIRC